MAISPDQSQLIGAFFATKRQIRIIEKRALDKIPGRPKTSDEDACSFCAKPENETSFLIHADEKARICPECAMQLADMLSGKI